MSGDWLCSASCLFIGRANRMTGFRLSSSRLCLAGTRKTSLASFPEVDDKDLTFPQGVCFSLVLLR